MTTVGLSYIFGRIVETGKNRERRSIEHMQTLKEKKNMIKKIMKENKTMTQMMKKIQSQKLSSPNTFKNLDSPNQGRTELPRTSTQMSISP